MKSVIPGEAWDFIEGPHYQQWLYMAGFFAFFLSYFVLPDYPSDSPSPAVFPLAVLLARGEPIALAPLFLGSLHRQLDLVHTDLARSLGRCDHLSMVHTSFLLTYFYEHFPTIALVPRSFPASAQRSRVEWWYGTSSDATTPGMRLVILRRTLPRAPTTSPGVVGISQCLLSVHTSVSAASGGDSVINATLIADQGWLPCIYNEVCSVTLYRPDRFAR